MPLQAREGLVKLCRHFNLGKTLKKKKTFRCIIPNQNLAQFCALVKNDAAENVLGVTLKFRESRGFCTTGPGCAWLWRYILGSRHVAPAFHRPVLCQPDGSAPRDAGSCPGQTPRWLWTQEKAAVLEAEKRSPATAEPLRDECSRSRGARGVGQECRLAS